MHSARQGYTREALIQGCKDQDRHMQTLLFKEYYPILLAVISRYIKYDDDRKEVLQEVFIKIYTRIDQLKEIKVFDAWVKRIVINQCFDQLKKNKKELPRLPETLADTSEEDMEETDEQLADQVTLADVHEVLGELAEGYRTVFMLYTIDELSHKEIAALLKTSESNSKSQYLRAKNAIKKLIMKKFDHAGKAHP